MHLLLLPAMPQRWKNLKGHWFPPPHPHTHTHAHIMCALSPTPCDVSLLLVAPVECVTWVRWMPNGSHAQAARHSPTAVGSLSRSHCSKQWFCLPLFLPPALSPDSEPPAAGYLQQHDWGQCSCESESITAASCPQRSFANKGAQFIHAHKHGLTHVNGRISRKDMISGIME